MSSNNPLLNLGWFRSISLIALLFGSFVVGQSATTIAIAPGPGHIPVVRIVVDGRSGDDAFSLLAYPTSFRGGVRVAVGDVNGDGVADIVTAPGPGAAPHIKVFDGRFPTRRGSLLMSFNAFPGFFRGGVFVAAGDVNGDGRADIIAAPDSGAPPIVRVFDGRDGGALSTFFAYGPTFTGGVRVATGDVNGDGLADIITGAGAGGEPHVKVFSGTDGSVLRSFLAYPVNFAGGVFVAVGDVNLDGKADIITGAGAGGGPHVKVFDAVLPTELLSFFAYDAAFKGGVRVAAGDVNGDGSADIITGAGAGGGPHVKIFNSVGIVPLASFFAFEPNFLGGVFVGAVSVPTPPR